ncbi:MAG: hypothetical protein O7C63_00035 [Alphaproteobacteria bacterium]|nr:hypothetical protein [Alphaproteobacteria bacterium]
MYRLSLLIASVVAALWSMPVRAQQQQTPCASRADFLDHLSANYKEAPVAMGLTANGGLLEVVASKDGSWTIIVTAPNGISCGVASGLSWEDTAEVMISDPGA